MEEHGEWRTVQVMLDGKKSYIVCRKLDAKEPFLFGNLEFSKFWTESQGLAEDYADALNVLALKERSKGNIREIVEHPDGIYTRLWAGEGKESHVPRN